MRNNRASTYLEVYLACLVEIVFPAVEETLSEGANVAGMPKGLPANLAKFGNPSEFLFFDAMVSSLFSTLFEEKKP